MLLIGNDGKQVALGDYRNAFHWKNIGNGKVIGEFVCDRIEKLTYNFDGYGDEWHEWNDEYVDYKEMCLSEKELEDYLGTSNGYGWHISALKIYDTPKELGEFYSTSYRKKGCRICEPLCDSYPNCALKKKRKPLYRPPQSWCYVEEL